MKLYSYWRSSASYRVRIVLQLKSLPVEYLPVHMVRDGGEQHSAAYRALNPQGLVPLLEDGDLRLNQSLAIMEYLEEKYPLPPLLPADPAERARIRALAQVVAADIHPLNNLRVLRYLSNELSIDSTAKDAWYHHWILEGFRAFEQMLAGQGTEPGAFCHGNQPGIAEACLIPQIYNAERFGVPLDAFPRIVALNRLCLSLEAFRAAAPEAQPDAEQTA